MKAAQSSKRFLGQTRMLRAVARGNIEDHTVQSLPQFLNKNDLVIVNSAGTLPASFQGVIARSNEALEVRLAGFRGDSVLELKEWSAVAFGYGSWQMPTERRGLPPSLKVKDRIVIGPELSMIVTALCPVSRRAFHLRFEMNSEFENGQHFKTSDLTNQLFQYGKPIQYSHLQQPLEVWDQQTIFAGAPISVEPPSAGFPFSWGLMLELLQKGVRVESILHSAGLSSTGSTELDRSLPFDEYYEVSERVIEAIEATHKSGGQVIAVGTTVVRAVETALASGQLKGLTSLKLGKQSQLRGIDAIFTGIHEAGSTHAELMRAFCKNGDPGLVEKIENEAQRLGYRHHEYGDVVLLSR